MSAPAWAPAHVAPTGLRSPNKCRKALANDACDRPRAFEGAALAVDHESGHLPRRQVRLEEAAERQQALLVSFIRRARSASPASAGNVYKVDRGRRVGSGAAALHELRTEAVPCAARVSRPE